MSPAEQIEITETTEVCVWPNKPPTVSLHGFETTDDMTLDEVRKLWRRRGLRARGDGARHSRP
ncbi:MAG TPA: hypothetical protein VFB89_06255 [Gemmatimonadales bacterium]|nr:hypothetical protein [Gemmatimonadales bacterium]